MYRIVLLPDLESVGSVGYWDNVWRDEPIYEMGWAILPPYQGKGIAAIAVAEAIERIRMEAKHRSAHAFPSIHNPASNAVCRKLGFSLEGECEFEYPPGSIMSCNDWMLKLGSGDSSV